MRDAGVPAARIEEKLNRLKQRLVVYVALETLKYLQKAGGFRRRRRLWGRSCR